MLPTISTFKCRRAILLILPLALVGCTDPQAVDNLPRKAVIGTVTLDGQPLVEGAIQFTPVELKPETTVAVGDIKDGKYSIDRAAGPVPGKYKISISSRAAVKISPGEPPGPTPKAEPEKVPAQYNTKSTLTKEVTVEGGSPIDFDLKSQ